MVAFPSRVLTSVDLGNLIIVEPLPPKRPRMIETVACSRSSPRHTGAACPKYTLTLPARGDASNEENMEIRITLVQMNPAEVFARSDGTADNYNVDMRAVDIDPSDAQSSVGARSTNRGTEDKSDWIVQRTRKKQAAAKRLAQK